MNFDTIWLSFDIEATGPVPGLHSMLSLGIVAIGDRGDRFVELERFQVNLHELGDYCVWDEDTKIWWSHESRREALRKTTENPKPPGMAMRETLSFLTHLQATYPGAPHVWAAYPATFDFPFVRYYMQLFEAEEWTALYKGEVMSRIACFDMGSFAMHLLRERYHDVSTAKMPDEWKVPNPMEHVALNDAVAQGALLIGMLQEARRREKLSDS